ncbi:glycosyltransferase [Arthrobacter sp. RT-1]|uniref:glycosyltransferase n=1 Tax=Arthrobacter sp. RT-1 TaxID=2292263 RepID=UPI000E1F0290|nr:glycosyltransferase [Arthrobacter sp. RT-1]RDV08112.1 glycosyltransferase [Arthrobacter sp. RT-1]
MRILHYYRVMTKASGVTSAIGKWQQALLDAGIESLVLHNAPADTWQLPSRQVRHVGYGRHGEVPLLAKHLLPGDFLVIHEGWTTSNIVAALTAKQVGVPYLIMPHGVYQPQIIRDLKPPLRLRMAAERQYLRNAAAVHTFFDTENILANDAAGQALRYITVPTGMEVGESAWTAGGSYLAWYGRYSVRHKGIDRMLQAYALIRPERRLPLRLHGFEYHNGRAEVLELVRKLGIADDVSVGGPVSGKEKTEFLKESAGFVFPSRWESHSIALLEALSLGLPVVVGETLHNSGQLKEAGAAVVIDFDDLHCAAAAMADLPGQASIGSRGREYVQNQLNWSTVMREYLAQLATLADGHVPPPKPTS